MSNKILMETIRANLQPQGTENIVRMLINEPYFDYDFIRECIDEMEKKLSTTRHLDAPSKLEILAMEILKDSAHTS